MAEICSLRTTTVSRFVAVRKLHANGNLGRHAQAHRADARLSPPLELQIVVVTERNRDFALLCPARCPR